MSRMNIVSAHLTVLFVFFPIPVPLVYLDWDIKYIHAIMQSSTPSVSRTFFFQFFFLNMKCYWLKQNAAHTGFPFSLLPA